MHQTIQSRIKNSISKSFFDSAKKRASEQAEKTKLIQSEIGSKKHSVPPDMS